MRRSFALTVTVLAAAIVLIYAPTFAQEPDPPEPAPSSDAQLAISVAALTDALTSAQTGQAGVDVAMADQETAEALFAAAQQHVADAVSARDGSHGTVLDSIDSLIEVLQALRAEHAPPGE